MADFIWANLLHLSYNMWEDRVAPECPERGFAPYLRCDRGLWTDLTVHMAEVGMNMLVLDLGDGVQWQSHPELAVEGAWTCQELREELVRLRDLGLEPIPKLNFATTHDAWLGPYSRCVSTPLYYEACRDLIAEVVALFDGPRLFHLGMDEEGYDCQRYYEYVVIRQLDLWWHDLEVLVGEVTRNGSRAWIWSDDIWHHHDEFLARMPQSVLQSNWYYATRFDDEVVPARSYVDLETAGYDQIPTGSNWSNDDNFHLTVEYCRRQVAPERLLGFMTAPWRPTLEKHRQHHLNAIDQVGAMIAK